MSMPVPLDPQFRAPRAALRSRGNLAIADLLAARDPVARDMRREETTAFWTWFATMIVCGLIVAAILWWAP
jgi:hypothetical protein